MNERSLPCGLCYEAAEPGPGWPLPSAQPTLGGRQPSLASFNDFVAIRALVTDAFGTIARIQAPRRPYAQLKALMQMHEVDCEDFAFQAMSRPLSFAELCEHYQFSPPAGQLARLEKDLRTELESIMLHPEAIEVLDWSVRSGLQVIVASNLAWPYGHTLTLLLQAEGLNIGPFSQKLPVSCAYSYLLGCCKPSLEFYSQVARLSRMHPSELLMIGDRMEEDIRGPRRAGWAPGRLIGEDVARAWREIHDELAAAHNLQQG